MEVKQVYIYESNGTLKTNATVDVAGLGDIKFDCALSERLIAEIRAEVEVALRVRLGQTLGDSK